MPASRQKQQHARRPDQYPTEQEKICTRPQLWRADDERRTNDEANQQFQIVFERGAGKPKLESLVLGREKKCNRSQGQEVAATGHDHDERIELNH